VRPRRPACMHSVTLLSSAAAAQLQTQLRWLATLRRQLCCPLQVMEDAGATTQQAAIQPKRGRQLVQMASGFARRAFGPLLMMIGTRT
jgi:hypothetical protein